MDKQLDSYFMYNNDVDVPRLNYEMELRALERTRQGLSPEESALSKYYQEETVSERPFDYTAVASLTVHSRAMIEGGVSPDVAYALCDSYFRKLAHCRNRAERVALVKEAQNSFAEQVKETNNRINNGSWTEKIVFYVDQHLNQPFSLEDLATALYADKAHLSRVFKVETGQSIMNYTRQRRLEMAAKTLRYSNLSLTAISEMFCFSTQSHFTRLFKEANGKTPRQYRKGIRWLRV
ncbi:hypothetical protein OfM2_15460 [Lactovum odontotermitis]